MKAYFQSVIVVFALATQPVYSECVPSLSDQEMQAIKQEAMKQIEQDLKDQIPLEMATQHQMIMDMIPADSMIKETVEQHSEKNSNERTL